MRLGVVCAVLCAFVAAGCRPDLNEPSLEFYTEFFDGTLQPGVRVTHNFNIVRNGQLTATVLSAGSAVFVRFGLGIPEGGRCDPAPGVFTTFPVSAPPEMTVNVTAGPVCVILEDAETLAGPGAYRIRVHHT